MPRHSLLDAGILCDFVPQAWYSRRVVKSSLREEKGGRAPVLPFRANGFLGAGRPAADSGHTGETPVTTEDRQGYQAWQGSGRCLHPFFRHALFWP
jgi:hypothetical protein